MFKTTRKKDALNSRKERALIYLFISVQSIIGFMNERGLTRSKKISTMLRTSHWETICWRTYKLAMCQFPLLVVIKKAPITQWPDCVPDWIDLSPRSRNYFRWGQKWALFGNLLPWLYKKAHAFRVVYAPYKFWWHGTPQRLLPSKLPWV